MHSHIKWLLASLGVLLIISITFFIFAKTAEEPKIIKIYKAVEPLPKEKPHEHTHRSEHSQVFPETIEPGTPVLSFESPTKNDIQMTSPENETEADVTEVAPAWTDGPPETDPPPEVWEDPNTSDPNLSPKEKHRNQLVKKHGDIEEVDMFIDLYYHMKEGPVTFDELVTMQELMYFFYPNAANKKGIEEMRALRSEVGGDTIAIPATQLPPDVNPPVR